MTPSESSAEEVLFEKSRIHRLQDTRFFRLKILFNKVRSAGVLSESHTREVGEPHTLMSLANLALHFQPSLQTF